MKSVTRFAKLGLPMLALMAVSACSGGEKAPDAAPETTATADVPASVDAAPAGDVALASLTGSAAAGEKIFKQCMACHSVKAGENKLGPSLHGIIGRPAGQVAGYKYSTANQKSAKTWDEETMFSYIEAPQRAMPGTKMAFAGVKKPQDRADLIAYLKLQK